MIQLTVDVKKKLNSKLEKYYVMITHDGYRIYLSKQTEYVVGYFAVENVSH